MAHYAIGDIQGCYLALEALLAEISFHPSQDTLYLVGDLVNRGEGSLETLRYLKSLGDRAVIVLGNHDFHLLAVATGQRKPRKRDTLNAILEAPDQEELISWLRHQPILYQNKALNLLLVHAGIPPQWSSEIALQRAKEVEQALQGSNYQEILKEIFTHQGDQWREKLQTGERLSYITNALTRMRFCTPSGTLDLDSKDSPLSPPKGYSPWFNLPPVFPRKERIIFGHWATLGIYQQNNLWGLDGGCVWGNSLVALNLETEKLTQIPCQGYVA